MDILNVFLIYLGIVASGYLIGSVSWARIITKYFYHVDIYSVGSGNAGGTNVGRAVGKKAAIIVIVLDSLKCILPLWIWFFILTLTNLGPYMQGICQNYLPVEFFYYSAGLAAGIGHVYPIYTKFRGGKAVSCYAGFVVGTNWVLTLIGCICFFGVLAWRKRVSLSSILGVTSVALSTLAITVTDYFYSGLFDFSFWFFPGPKMSASFFYLGFIIVYTVLVIVLHKPNIKRLAKKKEPETHFRHKGEEIATNYDSAQD